MNSDLYEYAIRLLARRAHSREELRRKMFRRGHSSEISEVLARLEELGYVNDQEFALLRARNRRMQRRWGNQRIAFDLKRLGVDARIIRFTLQRLEDEYAELDALRTTIEAWVTSTGRPDSAQALKKLYDHCLRLGHAASSVRSELAHYFVEIEWN